MKILSAQLALTLLLALSGHSNAQTDRLEDGRKAYQASCAHCHDCGELDAPIISRAADWDNRSHLWDAVLFKHAEEGFLDMPAKGGVTDTSAYDVKAAAEYMLTITHPELPHD